MKRGPEAPASPTTVLVAEPHSLFRAAIGAAIDAEPDLHVVGEAADGPSAAVEMERHRPDVMILDAQLPPDDAIRTCAAVRASGIDSRILVIYETSDQNALLEAFDAGADGYVSKHESLAELLAATRSVARGEVLVPPRMIGVLLRSLIDSRRRRDRVDERFSLLSRREREVLALLVEGSNHKAIAAALWISPATARTHLQNVMRKLEVHSVLEAAALAHDYGFRDQFPNLGATSAAGGFR